MLQLTGQNLGRVFNSKIGRMYPMHLSCYEAKLPSLKLKTRPQNLTILHIFLQFCPVVSCGWILTVVLKIIA
jgi:hypothetical protein